ncbi:MAG TPA: porin, partial [Allosphingosinicella sp.]
MRFLLLTGTALTALAAAGPACAQEPEPPATGDAIVDRLNALEARVKQLEARNAELEQQAASTQTRVETAEKREAKQVQFGWAPTLSDEKGDFTFRPRGVIEADYALFDERAGGYDYNDGTAFRRARIGLEGTA